MHQKNEDKIFFDSYIILIRSLLGQKRDEKKFKT